MTQCIIIGAGPSLYQKDKIKKLADSGFYGKVIVTDRALEYCLANGITPDKFEMYCTTIEYGVRIVDFFIPKIVQEKAKGIKLVIFDDCVEIFENYLRKIGFEIIKTGRNEHFPILRNVGLVSYYVAVQMLKCETVTLIGMDMSRDMEWYDKLPESVQKYLTIDISEINNKPFVLDPWYDYFRKTMFEYIKKYPSFVTNCSGQGSLFGDNIRQMDFETWTRTI